MALKHTKFNADTDDGVSEVQPSHWNADHVTDADGLTMVSGSSIPATPDAGFVQLFGQLRAGRHVLSTIDSSGVTRGYHGRIGDATLHATWMPVNGTTGTYNTGLNGVTTAAGGTLTARSAGTTNAFTRIQRFGYVSAATAGGICGQYCAGAAPLTVGTGTLGIGGFTWSWIFGCSDAATVSGARQFVGLTSSTATPTNVNPSTLTNCIGIAQLSGSSNLQIVYGGSAAQTPIDLGANFPANTLSADGYRITIFCPSTSNNTAFYRVERIGTSFAAEGTLTGTAGVALPSSTQFLNPRAWRTNDATALAVAIDVGLMTFEKE